MKLEIKDKIIIGLISVIIVISAVGAIRYSIIKEQSPRISALKRDKYFIEEYKTDEDVEKDNKRIETQSREMNLTVVNKKEEIEKKDINKITVDIEGAVQNPGVYILEENLRLDDLIKIAGGLKEAAETKGLNKAMKLLDEGYYYIFSIGEEVGGDLSVYSSVKDYSTSEESGRDRKININTASIETLQHIPGIGEVKAASIIEYREKNGGFNSIEELKNISGIGDKTFEKLRDYIDIR